jgi:hypothetical protein
VADSVTVTINGNASGLKDAVAQAGTALGELGAKAGEAGKGIGGFGGILGEVGGGMGEFIGGLGEMFKMMAEWEIINKAAEWTKDLFTSMIDLNSEQQQMQIKLTALTGSSGAAQKLLDWTNKFSLQIPYTRQDLMGFVTSLEAMGINAQQAAPPLIDLSALMGQDLPTAGQALLDVMTEDRWTMWNRDMKVNKADLEKFGLDVKDGAAGIQSTMIPALERWEKAHKAVGFAQKATFGTWSGLLNNILDVWQRFEQVAGKPLFGVLQKELSQFANWILTHQAEVQHFAEILGNGLANAVKTVANFISSDLIPGLQKISSWWNGQGNSAFSGMENIIKTTFLQAWQAILIFINNVESRLGPALHNLQALWDLIWPGLATTLQGVWNVIQGIVRLGWDLISGIILIGLDLLGGNWSKAWDDLKTTLKNVWGDLGQIVQGGMQILLGLIEQQLGAIVFAFQAAGAQIEYAVAGWVDNAINSIPGPLRSMIGLGGGSNLQAIVGDQSAAMGNAVDLSKHAAGGLHLGGWALVGEQGPELAWLPSGTNILNAASTQGLMSTSYNTSYGGGNTVNVIINGGDLAAVRQAVQDALNSVGSYRNLNGSYRNFGYGLGAVF